MNHENTRMCSHLLSRTHTDSRLLLIVLQACSRHIRCMIYVLDLSGLKPFLNVSLLIHSPQPLILSDCVKV